VTPGVSIVIPSWNGLELLKRFLPSVIAAATHYGQQFNCSTEIVIVNDGSIDHTNAWLLSQGFADARSDAATAGEEWNSRGAEEPRSGGEGETGREGDRALQLALRLIRNETNRGFGPTCNRGFEAASYPLVFLLNNDVDVELNAIAPLVENFADPAVFAAHCRVFDLESGREVGTGKLGSFARGFIRVHRSYVCVADTTNECGRLHSLFAGGGSAMFDRQKFLEIGGFDSLLAPIYWEDVDISYRAWKRGLTVVYEPRSVVHHRVSSTMRKVNQRKVRRMQQRHRLIYHWINLHDGALMASHVMWVALLSVTAPLRLQPGFLLSVAAALKKLPQIRARRLEEKQAAQRTDREVFEIFASLEKRANTFAYDKDAELEAARAKRRNGQLPF
jgi:GT2 family glycosyltransferase